MITIDTESKQRVRIPLDIDNFAERYKCSNKIYTFTAPTLSTIEKNLFYLLKNSTEKQFDPKYKMRPSYLSYDEYNTVVLDYLLMYINNVYCVEDFDLVTVIVPSLSSIINICQDKVVKKDTENLESVEW